MTPLLVQQETTNQSGLHTVSSSGFCGKKASKIDRIVHIEDQIAE